MYHLDSDFYTNCVVEKSSWTPFKAQ